MREKVLLVDDDENLLRACERGLRKRFDLSTALGGEEALRAIECQGPFAVVVSDMRMPEMDGIQFLAKAQSLAPDSVRMMLTGNADVQTAMSAVNEGNVFRFITKPCPSDQLGRLIDSAIAQYRLVLAERELLEDTLHGAIQVCTEILSAVDSRTFGHALKVRDLVRPIGEKLGVSQFWQMEVATLLARIGNATVPPVVMVRHRHGNVLTGVEKDMVLRVPETGHDLLAKIPRLEPVARIVLYSEKRFDGSGTPSDEVYGTDIPLEARILKVVSDFVDVESRGETKLRALETLRQRTGWYDPEVLEGAAELLCPPPSIDGQTMDSSLSMSFKELSIGDLLKSNVETADGVLVVQAGAFVTSTLLERMRNFAKVNPIKEPVVVERVPMGRPIPVPDVVQ